MRSDDLHPEGLHRDDGEQLEGSRRTVVHGSAQICTICEGGFDLALEGGVEGFIGILPVAFCPTCKAGIFDFVEQHSLPSDEDD